MKNLSIGVVFLILCAACSDEHPSMTTEMERTMADVTKESHKAQNSCLLDYAAKYDQLLTLSEAAAIVHMPEAAGTAKYSKVLKNTAYHSVTYKWKGEGTMNRAGFDLPRQLIISVSGIKPFTAQEFDQAYTARTDQEIAALNEKVNGQLEHAVNEPTKDNGMKDRMDKLEKMGIGKDEVKKTAGSLSGSIMRSLKFFVPVAGLGDKAAWNTQDNELFVLKNGVLFRVNAQLVDDGERNKTAALEAARIILSKCN